jgi:hypothetical protein
MFCVSSIVVSGKIYLLFACNILNYSIVDVFLQIAHLVLLLLFAAVPVVFLNLPIGVLAGLYAEARRKKALAHSKVSCSTLRFES